MRTVRVEMYASLPQLIYMLGLSLKGLKDINE
jgi:hypothetical protein